MSHLLVFDGEHWSLDQLFLDLVVFIFNSSDVSIYVSSILSL